MPSFQQFRVDNVTETIPVSLPYGREVYYKDANGILTLYVGNEAGVAQPINANFPVAVGASFRNNGSDYVLLKTIGPLSVEIEPSFATSSIIRLSLFIDGVAPSTYQNINVMCNAVQVSNDAPIPCSFCYASDNIILNFGNIPSDEGFEISIMALVTRKDVL